MEKFEKEDIESAIEVLKKGGIILYPTDTVWGIGCDASNAEAVEKIYKLKERADSKSMLSLVGSEAELERTVANVPETAWQLLDVAVNPLTIIYDKPVGLAENLLAEDGSAGIRVTSDPFCQALCRRMRGPIVSTSANISGEPTPANFKEIDQKIIKGVDYVVKYRRGDLQKHKSSNIIKVTDKETIKVIR